MQNSSHPKYVLSRGTGYSIGKEQVRNPPYETGRKDKHAQYSVHKRAYIYILHLIMVTNNPLMINQIQILKKWKWKDSSPLRPYYIASWWNTEILWPQGVIVGEQTNVHSHFLFKNSVTHQDRTRFSTKNTKWVGEKSDTVGSLFCFSVGEARVANYHSFLKSSSSAVLNISSTHREQRQFCFFFYQKTPIAEFTDTDFTDQQIDRVQEMNQTFISISLKNDFSISPLHCPQTL